MIYPPLRAALSLHWVSVSEVFERRWKFVGYHRAGNVSASKLDNHRGGFFGRGGTDVSWLPGAVIGRIVRPVRKIDLSSGVLFEGDIV